jgi:hypothetical protein
MGGIENQGSYSFPFTGGKPLFDWSGLDPSDLEHNTREAFTPKCLRSKSPKAASNFDGRRAGLYPSEPSKRFKTGDDIDELCRKLLEEFTDWGMDTITYRPNPSNPIEMISVLDFYPHVNLTNMAGHDIIQASFDTYDKENDTAAKKYFLKSLSELLEERILQRIKPSSSFVDVFLIFLDIELPSNRIQESNEGPILLLSHAARFLGRTPFRLNVFVCVSGLLKLFFLCSGPLRWKVFVLAASFLSSLRAFRRLPN